MGGGGDILEIGYFGGVTFGTLVFRGGDKRFSSFGGVKMLQNTKKRGGDILLLSRFRG